MANAVFYHKPDSIYDDDPADRYHFPKTYLSRVEQTLGDWIVYYGPLPARKGRFYTALARAVDIRPDPDHDGRYYVSLEDYLDFDRPIGYTENGGYEHKLFRSDGKPNGGRTQQAVRIIEPTEFEALFNAGLSEADPWPARVDVQDGIQTPEGLSDLNQAPMPEMFADRDRKAIIVNRPFRDAKFRLHIRKLYDRTCAFTGLRLINGQGRPEVEAAHIVPVEKGGNDSVQNGLALSGTVHWMFDRGLLSLSDTYDILPSRHLNYDVAHLLNSDMKAKVPEDAMKKPHPRYLEWHRSNIFKH
ncbi:HNH endonuclease [Labrenzia sp. OB1]|uniref:HNH endonuclease n=1 Tax=Labrenzia sp. OB1 TaxID=1561204 RepID=UPI0007B1C747|nr:HNH endonuclease [Labrenzia sp. OB1]KZM47608.1 HNH endonuclease [Labrenzia sp. OB1]